jgi:hypothetical protein
MSAIGREPPPNRDLPVFPAGLTGTVTAVDPSVGIVALVMLDAAITPPRAYRPETAHD